MQTNEIKYLEIPAEQVSPMKDFYGAAFGWTFQDWGGEYATFHGAGLEGGFNADASHKPEAPLVVLQTDTIETMEAKVTEAGGTITVPTFAFPGGRRFHFTDPGGNQLAVMQRTRTDVSVVAVPSPPRYPFSSRSMFSTTRPSSDPSILISSCENPASAFRLPSVSTARAGADLRMAFWVSEIRLLRPSCGSGVR